MKFGSVCSGIEAASVAFEPLGWKAAWFSEIEPFPCAVLKHHYPDTPNYGDMTTLPERIRSGEVEAPDLFCGGTPCQAFSVAGLRQSLADDRGNLSLTFCEIANAIDDVRLGRGESPAVIFWENVPGVLSTQDNAFGCFLGALSGCDTPISPGRLGWTDAGVVAGPQRTVSWRVLDAQYFGLAQRRRRVFVVASAREGFDPSEVLLEWQGVRRDFAPSRETGQGASQSPEGRAGSGCWWDGRDTAATLTTKSDDQRMPDKANAQLVLADTVTAKWSKGADVPPMGRSTGNLIPTTGGVFDVAHTLRGEGHDASEDKTGRGTPLVPVAMRESGQGYWMQDDIAGTLRAEGEDRPSRPSHVIGVPISFHPTQDPISSQDVCHAIGANENATAAVMQPVAIQGNLIGREVVGPQGVGASQDGVMYTLTKMDVHEVAQPVTYDLFNVTAPVNRQNRQPGDPCHTLARANAEHAVVVGVQPIALQDVRGVEKAQNGRGWNDDGTAYTVDTHATQGVCQPIAWDEELNASVDQAGTLLRGGQGGRHDGVAVAFVQNQRNEVRLMEVAGALAAEPGAKQQTYLQNAMQVRRLTPVECERLQGFPDGYTAIPWRGKPTEECPDGPRYKALGNSWAVPCVRWIGRRIQQEVQGKVPS